MINADKCGYPNSDSKDCLHLADHITHITFQTRHEEYKYVTQNDYVRLFPKWSDLK